MANPVPLPDFSIIDSILSFGVAILAMVGLFFLMIKYRIIGFIGQEKNNGQIKTCLANPKLCTAHEAEHDRSIRNERDIKDIRDDLKETRTKLFGKLEKIENGVTDIRVQIAKLPTKITEAGAT